jgi:hypothetical protein
MGLVQPSFLSCWVRFRCRGSMADDRAFLIVFLLRLLFSFRWMWAGIHSTYELAVDGSPHDCQVMLPFSVHLSSGHAVMGPGISYFICIDTIRLVGTITFVSNFRSLLLFLKKKAVHQMHHVACPCPRLWPTCREGGIVITVDPWLNHTEISSVFLLEKTRENKFSG